MRAAVIIGALCTTGALIVAACLGSKGLWYYAPGSIYGGAAIATFIAIMERGHRS